MKGKYTIREQVSSSDYTQLKEEKIEDAIRIFKGFAKNSRFTVLLFAPRFVRRGDYEIARFDGPGHGGNGKISITEGNGKTLTKARILIGAK